MHVGHLNVLRWFANAALAALLLLALATAAARAEPGSAGGIVGKPNKSVSGSDENARSSGPEQKPEADRPDRQRDRTPKADLGRSVSGSWDWEASCASGGTWQGGLTLSATSAGSLSGAFGKGHMGGIVGTVSGNQVSFYRAMYKQRWSGTLSGAGAALRMSGPVSDPARSGCRFSASKS
jgi:hypothetical protein